MPAGPEGRVDFVRASILSPLREALSRAGLEPGAFLEPHGIRLVEPDDPYAEFPLRAYVAAMEAAALAIRDPDLGARMGGEIGPDLLGPLGILFSGAPTLRIALNKLTRYLGSWQSGTRFELVESKTGAPSLDYRLLDPAIWPRRQDAEFTVAALCRLIRSRCGADWHPVRVELEHEEAELGGALGEAARAPIRYGQTCNRVVLRSSDLDRALSAGSDAAAPFLEQHLRDLIHRSERPATLVELARDMVAGRLGEAPPTLAEMADRLRLSQRTLQRRLAAAGTSLRAIVEGQRRQEAERLIRGSRLSMKAIAARLGYSDEAVLSRAFSEWTGRSPRAFRRHLGPER